MVIFHVDFFSVHRCYSGALSQIACGEDFEIISVYESWRAGADGTIVLWIFLISLHYAKSQRNLKS
jgi:hypothetical protein